MELEKGIILIIMFFIFLRLNQFEILTSIIINDNLLIQIYDSKFL